LKSSAFCGCMFIVVLSISSASSTKSGISHVIKSMQASNKPILGF
jgi:hypothetical protein